MRLNKNVEWYIAEATSKQIAINKKTRIYRGRMLAAIEKNKRKI